MLGENLPEVGWPDCGEIDITEHVGGNPATVHGTLHGPGYSGLDGGIGESYDTGLDLSHDFHRYAVRWSETGISWWFNDHPYLRLNPGDVPGPWPFDQPFYLLLNPSAPRCRRRRLARQRRGAAGLVGHDADRPDHRPRRALTPALKIKIRPGFAA